MTTASDAAAVLAPAGTKKASIPIWLARHARWVREAPLSAMQKAWVEAHAFTGSGRKHLLLPGTDGKLAGVVLGLGEARGTDPMDRAELALGQLAPVLPAGLYHLAEPIENAELAATAWGLGAYRFRRYKTGTGNGGEGIAQLKVPEGADYERALATVDGVWLGRDLINTPASDMGPQQLEEAARLLAKRHGAKVASIVGDDLLDSELSDDPCRRPRQRSRRRG